MGCTDSNACNFESWATEGDESVFCTYTCDDPYASNYDAGADGSCTKNETCTFDNLGCQDENACNYDSLAPYEFSPYLPPGVTLCIYEDASDPLNCVSCDSTAPEGYVNNDIDGDGICDEDEILGCLDEMACNYHQGATDSGPCAYQSICNTCVGKDNAGNGQLVGNDDMDFDGICDVQDSCTDILASNYAANPTENCVFICDELPSPLTFTSLTLGELPSSPTALEGTIHLEYSGGHGDSLAWQATIVDVLHPHDTLTFPLGPTIGPIPPSLYRISLSDGYGCASRANLGPDFFHSHDSTMLLTPGPEAGFDIIHISDSTHVRFALPFTICD